MTKPFEQLADAVRRDDVSGAREILDAHPELKDLLNREAPGESFGGLLIGAATRLKSTAMLDALIEHGADINARSEWWAGPFHQLELCDRGFAPELINRGAMADAAAAARLGDIERLRALLDEDPTRVHQRAGDGKTPLHYADTADIARLLLDRGADINALDVDHESTPAQYLVSDRPDVARFLLTRGAKSDILLAAALGATELVRRTLDESPDAIRTRVSGEWFPMNDPRAGGHIYTWTLGSTKSAYVVAREKGHAETAALLGERAAPEQMAADLALVGDVDGLSELLGNHPGLPARLNGAEAGALANAMFEANTAAVKLMLSAGWPVNAAAGSGMTPLHAASWHGHANLVGLLLTAGAPVNPREAQFGATPLGWAKHGRDNSWLRARGDYAAVIQQLEDAGATD